MNGKIIVDVDGTRLPIEPDSKEPLNPKEKIKLVFIKDRETGDSMRVRIGSEELMDCIKLIASKGHDYWSIPACDMCDGDGEILYLDLKDDHRYRKCDACLGYGIVPKVAA